MSKTLTYFIYLFFQIELNPNVVIHQKCKIILINNLLQSNIYRFELFSISQLKYIVVFKLHDFLITTANFNSFKGAQIM